MAEIRDLTLGRMSFPTLAEAVKETVGDQLDAVGAALTPGERQPRPLPLVIPVTGAESDANPYASGNRMRRQLRSLMENPLARMGGLYVTFSPDPELNGWLLVGNCDLEESDGGITLADYKLTMNDAYVVGRRRTHRPARRVELMDKRLSTSPRDYLRTYYSTDWAAFSGLAVVNLPPYISDSVGAGNAPLALAGTPMVGIDGPENLVTGRADGEVVHYEAPEPVSAISKGGVVLFDRKGVTAPTVPAIRTNLALDPDIQLADTAHWRGDMTLPTKTTEWPVGGTGHSGKWTLSNLATGTYIAGIPFQDGTGYWPGTWQMWHITAGHTYSFSLRVKNSGNQALRIRTFWEGTAETQIGYVDIPAGYDGRMTIFQNQTAPAGETGVSWDLANVSGSPYTGTVYITEMLLEESAAATNEYFDGDFAFCRWTGSRGASSSERYFNPQADAGWEEVYGPDWPSDDWTNGVDAPVIQNGRVRLRYLSVAAGGGTVPSLAFDQFVVGTGWSEQGRIWFSDAIAGNWTALLSARVVSWTPEGGVVKLVFGGSSVTGARLEVYVTLRRGWGGPRVEAYGAQPGGTATNPQIVYHANSSAEGVIAAPAAALGPLTTGFAATGDLGWSSSLGELTSSSENFATLQVGAMTRLNIAFTRRQTFGQLTSNTPYGGANNTGFYVQPTVGTLGYAQLVLALAAGSTQASPQAETYRNAGSGTTSTVANGAASGGNEVQDTQAAETAATVTVANAPTTLGIPIGKHAVWARVRVGTAGATGSIRAAASGTGAVTGAVATFSNTAYAWVYLGEVTLGAASNTFAINEWRSAGTGNVYIDRFIIAPTEKRLSGADDYMGLRDRSAAELYEVRQYHELVAR